MSVRILLIDDNPDACATAAKLLWGCGYQVDVAFDGGAALNLAEKNDYALAMIEYQMPGMNGVELFRRMRRLRPDLVGVLLTSNTTISVVYPAIEAGMLHVLAKPVDFKQLMAIIEECVSVAA